MGPLRRRSWGRRIRHRIVYGIARVTTFVFGNLPFNVVVAITRFLGSVGYFAAVPVRKRILAQLHMALGESLGEAEARRIAKGVFRTLGSVIAEVVHIPYLTPEEMKKRIRIADEPRFQRFMETIRKEGAIVITGHLGAWEWVSQYAPLITGTPLIAVARELSNPLIQGWMEEVRCRHGVEVVYRKRAGVRTFRGLKSGSTVGILLDQCTKGEGVFTPFFGRPAHTLTAPAHLAIRTGAPIFPAFLIREDNGRRMALHILDPVPLPQGKNDDDTAYQLTASLTSIIEEQVRRWPDQWVWIHRRWKRTPETDHDPVFDPQTGSLTPGMKPPKVHRAVESV